ncbi:MAG TPA: thiamine phosphate synthase [Hyphomicrobiaceae bacterium]|nr:thiamine phosphate synthase [Hyphomicrobiaceae bacterium]
MTGTRSDAGVDRARRSEPRGPQLCLELALVDDLAVWLSVANESAGPIASLILTVSDPGAAAAAASAVQAAQKLGIAALIRGNARLARTVRADGVHVECGDGFEERLEEAREIVGGRAIVGVDAGGSRHDAMTAGERSADYVAFARRGAPEGLDDQCDLVDWWSEIFEPPVVALGVDGPDAATVLAEAGADFLSVTAEGCSSAEEFGTRLTLIRTAIAGG